MSRRPQEPADPGRAAAARPAADIIHALILTASAQIPRTPSEAGRGALNARERELVTLFAPGRTDTQIAAELHISIRTVRSHLDRIRDRPAAATAPT